MHFSERMDRALEGFARVVTEWIPRYLASLPVPRSVDELVAMDSEKVWPLNVPLSSLVDIRTVV